MNVRRTVWDSQLRRATSCISLLITHPANLIHAIRAMDVIRATQAAMVVLIRIVAAVDRVDTSWPTPARC